MTTPLTPEERLRAALDAPSSKLARAIGKVRFGGTRSGHFFDEDGWSFLVEAVKEAREAFATIDRERRERVDPDLRAAVTTNPIDRIHTAFHDENGADQKCASCEADPLLRWAMRRLAATETPLHEAAPFDNRCAVCGEPWPCLAATETPRETDRDIDREDERHADGP